jgi:hypothetical protein
MIPVLHDVRAAFYLAIAVAMVVLICVLASLGAVLRPVRWADRQGYR